MPNIDMALQALDVGLNNGRDYVQGSEMLACLAMQVATDEQSDWRLLRASFHRMTDRCILIDHSAKLLDLDRHIAQVSFGEGSIMRDYFLVEAKAQAHKRETMEAQLRPIAPAEAMSGRFQYRNASGFWRMLDIVVQACKSQIQQNMPAANAFMFTGISRNTLPLCPGKEWATGTIDMTVLRRFGRAGTIQTMNNFRLEAESGVHCEGSFSFAFRTKGQ